MSTQETAAIARAFFDAINSHDADRIDAVVARDAEWFTDIGGGQLRSVGDLKQGVRKTYTAFPDYRVEITNLIPTDEWVTVEYVASGTHRGPLNLPTVSMQPTGQCFTVRFCDVYRIKDGKIVSGHNYGNMANLLQQLAAQPKTSQQTGLRM